MTPEDERFLAALKERYPALQDLSEVNADGWMMCCCPIHNQNPPPSFGINIVKRCFNCFVCGGGDIVGFVQKMEQCDASTAIKIIHVLLGVEADEGSKMLWSIRNCPTEQEDTSLLSWNLRLSNFVRHNRHALGGRAEEILKEFDTLPEKAAIRYAAKLLSCQL